jgi:hypothetical protein
VIVSSPRLSRAPDGPVIRRADRLDDEYAGAKPAAALRGFEQEGRASRALVRPVKADASSGRQSHQGKSQKRCSWMAARRETECEYWD